MYLKHLLLDPAAPAEAVPSVGAGAAALGATAAPAPTSTPAATPPSGTPSATPGGAAPTPTPTPTATQAQPILTASQTAELVQQTIKGLQPAAPEKQWTQEDFDKTFNVYKPTAQEITDVLAGGDGAITALNRIVAGIVKQATTMAALHQAQLLEDFEKNKLAPLSDVHKDYLERQTEKVKGAFFTKYPELKPHETLVIAVGTQLQQQGFKGTPEDAFKAVAEQVGAILKTAGVQPGGAPAQGTPSTNGTPPTHQMASLATPGGAGGAPVGGGQSAAKKSAGMSALD